MKTTQYFKDAIASNRDFLDLQGRDVKKSIVNKVSKEIKFYTELLRYLETNPKEEFVSSEIKRLKKLINAKNVQFENWSEKVCSKDVPIKKRRALFNKENEIGKHRLQLKNLEILIN